MCFEDCYFQYGGFSIIMEILNNTQIKRKKTTCAICGKGMESPAWEEPPFYCWKCSDKHEIGREDV